MSEETDVGKQSEDAAQNNLSEAAAALRTLPLLLPAPAKPLPVPAAVAAPSRTADVAALFPSAFPSRLRDFSGGESRLHPRESRLATGARIVCTKNPAKTHIKKHREPSVRKRMKPEFAFDICHDIYKGAREVLESKRGLCAFDMEGANKYLWRPDIRPRLGEYVADFALAGAGALGTAQLGSRLALFRVYYVGGANYHRARRFMGLSEYTWSQWVDEIRQLVGAELLRRGMFPPRKYFQEPTR